MMVFEDNTLQLRPANLAGETAALADALPCARVRTVRRFIPSNALLAREGRPALIHAIGRAVFGAVLSRAPLIYTPDILPTSLELRGLKAMARRRAVHAVTTTQHSAKLLAATGIFRQIHTVLAVPAPRPAARLRAQLDLEARNRVVMVVGDSTRIANQGLAIWATGMLYYTDDRWRVLLSGEGSRVDASRRFAENSHSERVSRFSADFVGSASMESLAVSSDFLIDCSSGPFDSAPLLRCMRMGKPIIANSNPTSREILPSECLLPAVTPRLAAQRLAELADEPAAVENNVAAITARYESLAAVSAWERWKDVLAAITTD